MMVLLLSARRNERNLLTEALSAAGLQKNKNYDTYAQKIQNYAVGTMLPTWAKRCVTHHR